MDQITELIAEGKGKRLYATENPDEAAIKYMRWQSRIQRSIAEGLLRSESGKEAALRHITLADMIDEQADELEA